MKKLAFSLLSLAVASLSLVACSDDDDDDNSTVIDMTSATVEVSSLSFGSTYTGVTTYAWMDGTSSAGSNIIAYEFNEESVEDGVEPDGDSFYGGIRPTWFTASSDENFAPASGAYRSGSGALVVNPGTIYRAIFRQTVASMANSIKGLYINGTQYLVDNAPYDLSGNYINVYVKGYDLNSSSLSSFSLSSLSESSAIESDKIELLSEDGDVLSTWTYLDLSDLSDCEIFEFVFDTDATEISSGVSVTSGIRTGDMNLGTFLVDDITFEGFSILSYLTGN